MRMWLCACVPCSKEVDADDMHAREDKRHLNSDDSAPASDKEQKSVGTKRYLNQNNYAHTL